jgi:hypothetical protein
MRLLGKMLRLGEQFVFQLDHCFHADKLAEPLCLRKCVATRPKPAAQFAIVLVTAPDLKTARAVFI